MSYFDISYARPWLLLLLIPVLFLAIWPYTRIPRSRRRTANRIASLALRVAVLLIVTSLLAGVSCYASTNQTETIIVVDLSDSTGETQSSMNQFISSIMDNADAKTKIGIVTFGYDSICAAEPDSNLAAVYKDYLACKTDPNASATNLAGTLYYAETLFSEAANQRLILLTDGEQTDGNAEQAAADIAADGVRVDAVYFDTSAAAENEVQISAVELPAKAAAGDTVAIKVTLESSLATTGTLLFYDNDSQIAETAVAVASGINDYTASCSVSASGIHTIRVKLLASNDAISVNNTMYSYIDVSGAANILIIDGTGSESGKLVAILKSDYNVTVTSSAKAPKTMDGLRVYDEVILMNVSNNDLPAGFADLLEKYASEYGGGVLTSGGDNTYIYGSMAGTALADLLPVDVSLDDTKTVAMMILIDNSSSMSGTNLTMAKEGAVNSINSLGDADFVGVIAFNAQADILAKLTPISKKADIIAKISKLSTVRGTYMYDAVYEAYTELKSFNADIKHVIILSDGNPSDTGYKKVIQQMAALGITTSTIAVGSGADTAEMKSLAELGGGRYYYVGSIANLPDIMLNETIVSQGEYFNNTAFVPEISSYTKALNGVKTLPELGGYIGTTLKEGATLVLYTDVDSPVYAEWQYGLGRVGSFTSDLNGEWSSNMLMSGDGVTFVRNVVADLLPDSSDVSGIYLNVQSGNYTAHVQAGADLAAGQTLTAAIVSPKGSMTTLALIKTSAGMYEGTMDTSESGLYTITAQQVNSDGSIADYTQQSLASSYSAEYDAFADNNGEELLDSVCLLAGGEVMTTAKQLFSVKPAWVERELNLFIPMLIIVLVLFLADMVLRKFRLKKPHRINDTHGKTHNLVFPG